MRKLFILVILFSAAVNTSGCVHRNLTIRSNPPGATVYFNDHKIGETPAEFDFMWYHDSHKVRLEKNGYETLETIESIKCPPYLYTPLDLIAEIMPVKIEDRREFSYDLVPKSAYEELAQ